MKRRNKSTVVRDALAIIWLVACVFVAGVGLASLRMNGL